MGRRLASIGMLAVLSGGLAIAGRAQSDTPQKTTAPEVFPAAEELAKTLGLTTKDGSLTDPASGERKPITVYVGRDGSDMVFVPGGPFAMGAGYSELYDDPVVMASAKGHRAGAQDFEKEQPKHTVVISPFFIDRCEVTNAQYQKFLAWWEQNGRSHEFGHADEPLDFDYTPWMWQKSSYSEPTRPVVGVSWFGAYAYAGWAGKRLPTEAEWEKAARGTDSRRFPWGNTFDPRVCNSGDSFNLKTVPVGSFEAGQSPYGCYDMAGNAWEWVLDWMNLKYYDSSPDRDPLYAPAKAPNPTKVVRGGSWIPLSPLYCCRTTMRGAVEPWPTYAEEPNIDEEHYMQHGFRCVASPKAQVPAPLTPERWQIMLRQHPGARHRDGTTVVPPLPPVQVIDPRKK